MDINNKKVLQFGRTFRDMIKCPDCDKTLTYTVFMCGNGHSICSDCHSKRIQCKKCNAPYTLMKNVLIQNLLVEFEDIKPCLEELNAPKIQPESVKATGTVDPTFSSVKLKPHHYHCWITTECEYTGCVASIIQHLNSSAHPKRHFKQHTVGKLPFEKYWDMDYSVRTNFNRAIRIPKVGLFTVYIWRNADEELRACIFMYADSSIAAQYSYTIRIQCGGRQLSFTHKVESARSPKPDFHGSNQECLILHRDNPLYIEIKENVRFKCSIVIKSESNQLQVNNSAKKKGNNKLVLPQCKLINSKQIININNPRIYIDPNMLQKFKLDGKSGSLLQLL